MNREGGGMTFVWMGEELGEVERVVVEKNVVTTHIKGGEVKKMARGHVNIGLLLDDFHRHGVPVVHDGEQWRNQNR